jgi:hypothetical protein
MPWTIPNPVLHDKPVRLANMRSHDRKNVFETQDLKSPVGLHQRVIASGRCKVALGGGVPSVHVKAGRRIISLPIRV